MKSTSINTSKLLVRIPLIIRPLRTCVEKLTRELAMLSPRYIFTSSDFPKTLTSLLCIFFFTVAVTASSKINISFTSANVLTFAILNPKVLVRPLASGCEIIFFFILYFGHFLRQLSAFFSSQPIEEKRTGFSIFF